MSRVRTALPQATAHGRLRFAALYLVQFIVVLDVTIVNVALPAIGADLGLGPRGLPWVISAYAVFFGGFLLVGGRAGDLLGRRRVFLAGLALFSASSLVCGLAWSPEVLIVARSIQGLGAALLSPTAFAMLATSVPEGPPRTRAIGLWGSTGAAAAMVGMVLGGVLAELVGWHWIFLLNLPVAAIVAVASRALLREHRAERSAHVDVVGAALVTGALLSFVYGLSNGPTAGWISGHTLATAAIGTTLLLLFVRRQTTTPDPLVPSAALAAAHRRAANVAGFVQGAMMLATLLLLSIAMQEVLGFGAVETGLGLLAIRGTSILWAQLGVRLVGHVGPRLLLTVGMLAMALGVGWFTRLSPGDSYTTDLLPGLLLLGLGIPLMFLSVSLIANAGVRADEAGLVSGLLSSSQWIGGAIGVAAVSTAASLDVHGALASESAGLVAAGVRSGFVVTLGIALLGVAVALAILRLRCPGCPRGG